MRRQQLRRSIGRVLDCFCFSFSFSSMRASGCCLCSCARATDGEGEEAAAAIERRALVTGSGGGGGLQVLRLRDLVDGTASNRTLGFHLEPKMLKGREAMGQTGPRVQTVELRVSMHCNGCAKKVHKHISKMEGVTWFEVDLEQKKVVVTGEVTPLEVLQSISKVKLAQLWMGPS